MRGALCTWTFDGTDVYEVTRVLEPTPRETEKRLRKNLGIATVPFERARSNLTVTIHPSADGSPLGTPGVNIPWLAFASGNYLRHAGRIIPLPVDILHHTRDRFAYMDVTETFDDALGLPRKVELFTSKKLFIESESDFDREYNFGDRYSASTRKIAANLLEGILTFHYAVTASTNFLGWNIPTSFEFYQNGRSYEQNAGTFYRGVGRVTTIRASERPIPNFDPGLQQTVVDFRLVGPGKLSNTPLMYRYGGTNAPDVTDAEIQSKLRKRNERALK